ncbi:MAG: helix-turn-helix transcriptional regulator [Sandaracinus sp.]|nr:helix-turn-helix transcriptional regulator [Sandaracinus sp.]
MTLRRVNTLVKATSTSHPAKVVAKPSAEPLSLSVHVAAADDRLALALRRPSVVLPLQVGVIALGGESRELVDRARFVVWPVGRHAARVVSPTVRLLVLGISDALVDRVATLYRDVGFDPGRLRRWLEDPHVLARTTWVHEIAHRYLFERQACARHESEASRFLEAEIVKEIFFLLRDREADDERTSLVRGYGPTVQRAVTFVEERLFDRDLGVPAIAQAAGASESTLLRAFKREMGCAPTTYVRARRLDEALALLETGGLSVGEVAAKVGYDSLTAFSQAFRQRFGKAPSSARPRRAPR